MSDTIHLVGEPAYRPDFCLELLAGYRDKDYVMTGLHWFVPQNIFVFHFVGRDHWPGGLNEILVPTDGLGNYGVRGISQIDKDGVSHYDFPGDVRIVPDRLGLEAISNYEIALLMSLKKFEQ